jgi:hypothetical protein
MKEVPLNRMMKIILSLSRWQIKQKLILNQKIKIRLINHSMDQTLMMVFNQKIEQFKILQAENQTNQEPLQPNLETMEETKTKLKATSQMKT